jgi:hypothetical protein
MNTLLASETDVCTAPERLRWIADFLDLADKAIAVVACAKGVEYPEQVHSTAQRDLRAWARWLDANPARADDMDVVRMVAGVEEGSAALL